MNPVPLDPTINSNNLENCVYILQHAMQNVLQKEKKALQCLADLDFPMKHYHPLSGFYPLKLPRIHRELSFSFLVPLSKYLIGSMN